MLHFFFPFAKVFFVCGLVFSLYSDFLDLVPCSLCDDIFHSILVQLVNVVGLDLWVRLGCV